MINADELKSKIVLSSIPLRKLGANNIPIDSAMGCLVQYAGKVLVLTVEHATGDFGNWAIEVEYVPQLGQTALYQIGQMNFLAKLTVNIRESPEIDFSRAETIDFSYAILKKTVTPLHQELDIDGAVKNSIPTIMLETSFQCEPHGDLEYGFYGHTKGKYVGKLLTLAPRLEMGMKFLGEDGEFYVFQMLRQNALANEYKGCSGAPILDGNGELVSLAAQVVPSLNQIYGVKLPKYRAAIDVECGMFSS
jgi:hypothetical protein